MAIFQPHSAHKWAGLPLTTRLWKTILGALLMLIDYFVSLSLQGMQPFSLPLARDLGARAEERIARQLAGLFERRASAGQLPKLADAAHSRPRPPLRSPPARQRQCFVPAVQSCTVTSLQAAAAAAAAAAAGRGAAGAFTASGCEHPASRRQPPRSRQRGSSTCGPLIPTTPRGSTLLTRRSLATPL